MNPIYSVGAIGYDSEPTSDTFVEGWSEPEYYFDFRKIVGTSWGFAFVAEGNLVRVAIPLSGRPTFSITTAPSWLTIDYETEIHHIECVSGSRVFIVDSEGMKVRVSSTLADASSDWTRALTVDMPTGIDIPTIDDDVEDSQLAALSAELVYAVVQAIRSLGDDVIYMPSLYARKWPDFPPYMGASYGAHVKVEGSALFIPDRRVIYDESAIDESVVLDTELITYRVDMSDGVAGRIDVQTVSSMGTFGIQDLSNSALWATSFDPDAQPPFFWTGYKLASETP